MCGILGQINKTYPIDPTVFNRMRDKLIHRGPDGEGTQILEEGKVALGHRRLSIIDLSENGRQPMCNEDKSIWLTFNGEIYNFVHLKKTLEQQGHKFKSNTDSEVIIHGYEQWGIQGLLQKLKGMFAFGLWDAHKQRLVAARDRFGIKPFYYYEDEKSFIFASEIKAINDNPNVKRTLDKSSLADYFTYSYVPHPSSIWEDIKKLPPATYLTRDLNGCDRDSPVKYWSLSLANDIISSAEAVEQADHLIKHSVNEHLLSDVPVGIFLSGGYDSSTVLSHIGREKEISSFSIGFADSKKSEHLVASRIASEFNTKHHEELFHKDQNNFELLKQLSYFYDEPFAISSMIPYYQVSKLASKHNKVVLVGDGGDEAFAGYKWHYSINDYFSSWSLNRVKNIFRSKNELLIELYAKAMTGISREVYNSSIISKDIALRVRERGYFNYRNYLIDDELIKKLQYLDFNTFIPEPCLTRADRSSMANSLEVRVPFLDHEIFEFTFSLHPSVYFKPNIKKYLLYENLKKHIDSSILNLPKRGFSFQHLATLVNNDNMKLLNDGMLMQLGIIDNLQQLKKSNNKVKFHFLVLELWYRAHYE